MNIQTSEYLRDMVDAYIDTALWSSTDNSDNTGGNPLDDNFDELDIDPKSWLSMQADCADFLRQAYPILSKLQGNSLSVQQVGHDFWLTRNGHGAGFWDRGLGKYGDELSEIADNMGTFDLYVGDNEKLYAD